MAALLLVLLSILFWRSYLPGEVVFSNDGPLGRLNSACHALPERFTGCWEDLNSVGLSALSAPPNISFGLQCLLGPVLFAKFYPIAALLFLGLGAWCFFRQMGLAPAACILGGLAATLNSSFFSVACWGVASHTFTVGLAFFALAALADTQSPRRWPRVMLAGFAVGMGVSEGADVGALFSILVAAYVVYAAVTAEGGKARNIASGAGRLILLAGCAALLGAQAVNGLVSNEIEGVVGMKQDAATKAQRWAWATQWSLPKSEVLSLAVPGLFGYRMEAKDGAAYWGTVGRDIAWDDYKPESDEKPPKGFKRFSGGSPYSGVLVLVVAAWAALQSFRPRKSVFRDSQRRLLWFWIGMAVVCVVLALGRYAPAFYRLVYALPYFSTMRNPVKFLNIFNVAVVVLFAYGLDGLWRQYLQPALYGNGSRWLGFASWWKRAGGFDRAWIWGSVAAFVLVAAGWAIYASNSAALEQYMLSVQVDATAAPNTAAFSIRQAGWFALLFTLSLGLLALILSGAFAGARAVTGASILGLLLVGDLARANVPWILYWDYPLKYASNPVIDRLTQQSFTHRVCILPFAPPPQYGMFTKLYQAEWLPHLFPYYNIQTIEVVQMSRLPEDLAAFEKAFHPQTDGEYTRLLGRLWELTNSRYVLGAAGYLNNLNDKFDPVRRSFRIVDRFSLGPKPGILTPERLEQLTVRSQPDGLFALFENVGVLPRAQLYDSWIVKTNAGDALSILTNETFNAHQQVVVTGDVPATPAVTNTSAGTVEFASYAPRHIVLKAEAPGPAVLLLNDHHDARWRVSVDGKPAPLLRCNFIMRGVYLIGGAHTVRFDYDPPLRALYVSLGAIMIALALTGVVVWGERRRSVPPPPGASPPESAVAEKHAPEPAAQGAPTAARAGAAGGKRAKQRRK
jgi:hypothetical protein